MGKIGCVFSKYLAAWQAAQPLLIQARESGSGAQGIMPDRS
jgi:hypothetical protein